jgi:hypothetical protein
MADDVLNLFTVVVFFNSFEILDVTNVIEKGEAKNF